MESDATVYICVIGDSGVGKTSLITAAATETFPDRPPPVLPAAKLPADTTPEGVPVVITDTSSRPEDKQALEQAAREANVIVLCFSMENPQSLRRVSTHWMPELRRLGISVPIILVGCKSDIRPADQSLHQVSRGIQLLSVRTILPEQLILVEYDNKKDIVPTMQAVLPIVKTYSQIEICMECSSKKLQFVGEVFYYALKSVLHPMAPLYEPDSRQLQPLCTRALKRIFLACDADHDGILNDEELNGFQVRCFNAPLQPEELAGVKQVVEEKVPEGTARGGLTLAGFLYLHALFIERGRLETTWAVLRRFGYGNDLHLRKDILKKAELPRTPDQVVELSPSGRAFFQSVFERFDVDDDGALSVKEREELFSTSPEDPWHTSAYKGVLVETTRKGLLTLQGFLAMWSYIAAKDPEAVLASAMYLGFPEDAPIDQLLTVSKQRRVERRGSASGRRTTFQCLAFDASGVSNSSVLLEGLITQARYTHGATPPNASAAAAAVMLPETTVEIDDDRTGNKNEGHPKGGEKQAHGVGGSGKGGHQSTQSTQSTHVTLLMGNLAYENAIRALLQEKTFSEEDLSQADVAAFVFDGTKQETFNSAIELLVATATSAGDTLPCVLVCLNDHQMSQDLRAEVAATCASLNLAVPMRYPSGVGEDVEGSMRRVYQTIITAALDPENYIPETPSLRAKREYRRMVRRAALIAAGGTVTFLGGYFLYRYFRYGSDGREDGRNTSEKLPS